MRGRFWNSRGLKDLAKRRFLAEIALEQRLDFVALSETGRDNFAPQFLSSLVGGIDFDWHCLPPRGRSGGILLGVRCDSLEVRSVVMGDFTVKFESGPKLMGLTGLWWRFMVPHNPSLNRSFWRTWFEFAVPSSSQFWLGVISISLGGERKKQ